MVDFVNVERYSLQFAGFIEIIKSISINYVRMELHKK